METQSIQIKSRKAYTEYKGVSTIVDQSGRLHYGCSVSSDMLPSLHRSPEAAAKAYDMAMIRRGKPPVNILKPIGRRAV